MGLDEKKLFGYIYHRNKVNGIETEIRNKGSEKRNKIKSMLNSFLKKAGSAALITLGIYEIFFYLNLNRLLLWDELSTIPVIRSEIAFAFLYILLVFLTFPIISSKLGSGSRFKMNPSLWKSAMEVLAVIFTNIILLSIFNYLPVYLLYPEIDPQPANLRMGYLVTCILALFYYFFVEREKSKKRLQEGMLHSAKLQKANFQAQLETLKLQVNPHFLFNSLNVLGSLINQNENRAVEFTRRLSLLYRSLLKHGEDQLINLQKELKVAEAYIYLLETRFGDAVTFSMEINDDKMDFKIPPGCLQMLIENAIKHNGSTRKKPLHIKVYTREDRLLVQNNIQKRMDHMESTGIGLENIQNRYRFITDKEVIIKKTEQEFQVSLPLLNNKENEYSNY